MTDTDSQANDRALPEDRPRAIMPEKRPNHALRAVIVVAVLSATVRRLASGWPTT